MLKRFGETALGGPTANRDIHSVKTFARDIMVGIVRDAEAAIAHMVSKGSAHVIHTYPTDTMRWGVCRSKFKCGEERGDTE